RRLARLSLVVPSGLASHRDLHSCPTRRSSDLGEHPGGGYQHHAGDKAGEQKGAVLSHLGNHQHEHRPNQDGIHKVGGKPHIGTEDRKSTRLNSSHVSISYAGFCLKKKTTHVTT